MQAIRYFDGHIIINIFGIIIRVKANKKFNCPNVKEIGICDEKYNGKQLIVSLTSFPERINIVVKTIKTLLNQTLKPNMLILWLAKEQFPNKENDLPKELLELRQYGLTIEWCNDIRSYKKIIPTLNKYPDSIIITTDDDIYYAPDTVETLYKEHLKYPQEVLAHRCDWLKINGDVISWEKTRELYLDKHKNQASFKNRLTGYGAVLYPPNCFYKDVCNEDLIKELLPTHDDVWLWAMTVLNGFKTRLIKGYSESINYVENSQQFGLCKTNKKGVGVSLDDAYKIILKKYPQILDILKNCE